MSKQHASDAMVRYNLTLKEYKWVNLKIDQSAAYTSPKTTL